MIPRAACGLVFVLTLFTTAGCAAPADPLGGQIALLTQLAVQFDADKDHRLSAAEQAALVEHVAAQHGARWGDRVKQFFARADANADGLVDETEFTAAVAQAVRRPAAAKKQTFMVPMSDGVRLATDVYLPPGKGPFPVVFSRTPYSRAKGKHGGGSATYAIVIQDMRGRFDSEGENIPFIGCGWSDHRDGAESVAWILKQPWSNGKVATVGGSALGITQNLMAATNPLGLVAQYISVAAANLYAHAGYVGGALRQCQVENWTEGNRFGPKAVALMQAHPDYDDWWRKFDSTLKFAEMNVPAVHQGGWFDTFAQGTIDAFVGRQHQGGPGSRGKQKLIMGPWDHGGWRRPEVGELRFPNNGLPSAYSTERWLEYHLQGVDNGIMREPAVVYYVMGDTSDPKAPGNQWRQAADWPVRAVPTPFYFHTGGELSRDKPPRPDAYREYTFDPRNPCPTIGGANLTIERGPRNQNPIETRPDVLTFTTEPLAEPLEVTGRIKARVYVSSSAVDTDVSVRFCDVYPDGKSYLLCDGILRLRHRNSMERSDPLMPGQVVCVEVDCWSTSMVFNRGHRIRATVTSSNSPRFDVNPGTGHPATDGGPMVRQTNRIFCDAEHPSAMILPICDGSVRP